MNAPHEAPLSANASPGGTGADHGRRSALLAGLAETQPD